MLCIKKYIMHFNYNKLPPKDKISRSATGHLNQVPYKMNRKDIPQKNSRVIIANFMNNTA